MAKTESKMIQLGTKAPSFSLPDVTTGQMVKLEQFADKKGFLVIFLCRHCPYVVHVQHEIARLGHDYKQRELGIVAISSNDAQAYPDDSPPRLKEFARDLGLAFPLCYDETQEVARAYDATCTPDFFLFDAARRLVYRGELDASRPGNGKPVDGKSLRTAIDALLSGKPIDPNQHPSLGCNIKWKSV